MNARKKSSDADYLASLRAIPGHQAAGLGPREHPRSGGGIPNGYQAWLPDLTEGPAFEGILRDLNDPYGVLQEPQTAV